MPRITVLFVLFVSCLVAKGQIRMDQVVVTAEQFLGAVKIGVPTTLELKGTFLVRGEKEPRPIPAWKIDIRELRKLEPQMVADEVNGKITGTPVNGGLHEIPVYPVIDGLAMEAPVMFNFFVTDKLDSPISITKRYREVREFSPLSGSRETLELMAISMLPEKNDMVFKKVRMRGTGTADDRQITRVLLVSDVNGDGLYQEGQDRLLAAPAVFKQDNEAIDLAVTANPEDAEIPAGYAKNFLIVYVLQGCGKSGDTFGFAIDSPFWFFVEPKVAGSSGQPVMPALVNLFEMKKGVSPQPAPIPHGMQDAGANASEAAASAEGDGTGEAGTFSAPPGEGAAPAPAAGEAPAPAPAPVSSPTSAPVAGDAEKASDAPAVNPQTLSQVSTLKVSSTPASFRVIWKKRSTGPGCRRSDDGDIATLLAFLALGAAIFLLRQATLRQR